MLPGSRVPIRGARWGSGASLVHFGGKFIKQKLLGTPNLVGIGHLIGPQIQIWKDLGLVCFWSLSALLSRRVYKTKVVVNVANSAWPQGQGYPIMLESSYKTLH